MFHYNFIHLIAGALGILANELVPSNDIHLPSPAYRKLVACSLLYKVIQLHFFIPAVYILNKIIP